MRSLCYLLLLLTSLLPAQNAVPDPRVKTIDSFLRESHQRMAFNGNVLVAEKGTVLYTGSFGHAGADRTLELSEKHRFKIGSIGKEFDGVGLMLLLEEGKLSPADDLTTFFPELPAWAREVRVKHLLQYTSGLKHTSPEKVLTDDLVWETLKALDSLHFAPGTAYDYNNINVFLRRKIIEKVSGMPYRDFVQQRLLGPCEMQNTLIDPDDTADMTRSFDHSFVPDTKQNYMSGTLAMDVRDLYRWTRCLGTQQLLSPESIEQLARSFDASSQSPLGLSAYDKGKLLFRWHHGQSNQFEAGVVWIPDGEYTIVLLANMRNDNLGDHVNAIDAILKGQSFEMPKRSLELSLRSRIFHHGFEKGMLLLDSLRQDQRGIYDFSNEDKDMLDAGDWLLENGRQEEGLKLLELVEKY